MCISETRLKGDPLINIRLPNYTFVHADSLTNAGGVGVYVSSKFQFEVHPTLEIKINGFENLWLNILDDKARYKFTIGAIYRHPDYSAIENFSEALSNSLSLLTKFKGIYYLLGDINITISPDKRTPVTETYLDCFTSCGAILIIFISTRVAGDSLTIFDHIITNDLSHFIEPGVSRCDRKLSDHYIIFCNVLGYHFQIPKQMQIFTRDKSNYNTETYCNDMNKFVNEFFEHLDEVTGENFDKSFEAFILVVQKVIDKHTPIKKMSRKLRKLKSKPWITKGILSSICTKNCRYKSHYILGDETRKHVYKVYANKLTKIKTLAKKNYYAEELDKNKSNTENSNGFFLPKMLGYFFWVVRLRNPILKFG